MPFPALVILGTLTGLQGVAAITGTEVQLAEGDAHYRPDCVRAERDGASKIVCPPN